MYVIFSVMPCGCAQAAPAKLPLVDSRLLATHRDKENNTLHSSSFRLAFSMIPPMPDLGSDRNVPVLHRPERYCSPNATRHENICMRRLTAKVTRLESALSGLLSAIVHADDIALNERLSFKMGRVYKDADMQSSRRPRMLRQSVQNVANMYNIGIKPVETNWFPEDIMSEIGEREKEIEWDGEGENDTEV